ncbi:aminodeoxychorismate/anthranilate synthase component II [Persicobacter diffluens]|uniref:Aminodeoxychorismate/anthranilate synthase component II n=1 Tax=Persicobacter diffluens TaxID=981 RepID=A0AAN4VW55_9BACT|nr:aminodeoxychorismate/anthranilate synthase component II [Persicobacter diffluens]
MKILVFDNYDSFTYNLVHMIRELGFAGQLEVHRNDQIALEEIEKFDKILLSPGPGIPEEAGILLEVIKTYGASKSIFGVCLGHQAISEVYGAELENMSEVYHGIDHPIKVGTAEGIFDGLPQDFKVCRYHSWTVKPETVKAPLAVTATDEQGRVMGVRHLEHDVQGVQFHPESILTEHGMAMMKNWLGVK